MPNDCKHTDLGIFGKNVVCLSVHLVISIPT